ncbi:MAG: DUF6226 family protein [Acidimicrobiales bacterium]
MTTLTELRRAVDADFGSRGPTPWPNPHPDRPPLDEEYSRVLDPGKWRIVVTRAEAWCDAARDLGVAALEHDVDVRWAVDHGHQHVRVDRLTPLRVSGLPLLLAYFGFEGVDINAVKLAAGDPAVELTTVPPCGCDACDSGSSEAIDLVDDHVIGLITGQFRHLTDGARTIVVHSDSGWRAHGHFADDEVDAVLADPLGWQELTGPSWLADD